MKTTLSLLILLATLVVAFDGSARVLVATNSTWSYFKGTSEASAPTNAWREPAFDDSGWLIGAAPFHYGTNAVGGDDTLTNGTLLTDMRGNYTCVFLRQTFVIDDTTSLRGLRLNLWFDDGFAVWINGQHPRPPVNVGGLTYTNKANSSREGTYTPISIDTAIGLLRNGTNILCLQIFNVGIADDDFRLEAELTEMPPSIAVGSATVSVQETENQAVVRVLRAGALDGGVSVDYTTVNGTALAGEDYVATNSTLTFAAGETGQTIVVPILNDGLREATETFLVRLSNPGGGAFLGSAIQTTVQITDNDPGFQVEFVNYYVHEDAGPVVLAVVRGNDGDFPATVDFSTSDLVAMAGSDYVATNGTLTFAAGENLKLVPVTILNDGARENRETFLFTLENPTSAVGLGPLIRATNTIFESDQGVRFERTVHAVHEFEGELRLTVLRGNDAELGPFTVDFATSNVTAIGGVDYEGTNGTLAFAENEMEQSFAVHILDDEILEPDRTFKIVLSAVTGAAALDTSSRTVANVTVCDDTGRHPQGFGSLTVSNNGMVRLVMTGGVAARFKPFLEIYPLEVSSNLVDWTTLSTLVRTNSSTNALVYVDQEAGKHGARFYRLAQTNLVTPHLAPSGPYAVGRADRTVVDPSRRNRYGISTNGSLAVSIWYPAVSASGHIPLPFDVPPRVYDVDNWQANWLDRSPWLFTYAVGGLDLNTNAAPYPVVLQSHGVTGARIDQQSQAENLASHGYVVVATDHYDSQWVVYPDGTYLPGSEGRQNHTPIGLNDRVADLVFLMNQLEHWNEIDPLLTRRLNLGQMAAIGFSWGGPTVGEFCRIDDRCKAAISLDGGWWEDAPNLLARGLQKPSLMINGSDNSAEILFGKAAEDAYWFQISASQHSDFTDVSWWPDVGRLATGLETSRSIHDYQVSFLKKYLKGQDDHLLDGPPGALFPRVINFKKK